MFHGLSPAHPCATPLCGLDAPSCVLAFVFAGVALQIRSDPALASRWRLPPAYLRYTDTSEGARCFVHATCSLALDAGFPASAAPSGVAAWQRVHGHGERCDALSVRGDQYAFDVQAVRGQGAPRFEVAARVASALIVPELFLQLAVTLGELAGGLCLHATAVEYAAQAVLLLGPSGAGKSTAAGLLGPAARCLAHDRVLVTQLAGAGAAADGGRPGFEVWALPIGRPPALEPSTAMVLPLAGLLRIRQVDAAAQPDATSSVRRVRPAGAALYVRQAVESPVGSGFFEPERLMTVSELVLAAPSGIADIALGQPWSAALAQFLRFSAAAAADAVETGAHAAEPVVAHSPF